MRRAASEYRRHVDTAVNREIGPRPGPALAEPQNAAPADSARCIDLRTRTIDRACEIRSRHRHQCRLLEPQFRTEQSNFERRPVGGITDQHIRTTIRVAIHWSRNRYATILIAPSAAILDGGEKARVDDGQATIRFLGANHRGSPHGWVILDGRMLVDGNEFHAIAGL